MSTLEIIFTAVAVLLIIVILLQQRSSALGGAFGGDSTVFTSRRGAELTLYRLTILLTIIFVGLAVYSLFARRAASPPTTTPDSAPTTESTAPTENVENTEGNQN